MSRWNRTRKWTQAMIERLRARDGDRCWLCAWPLAQAATKPSKRTSIEHLNPRSLGGGDEIDNLVLCHQHCNAHLRDRPAEKKVMMRAKWHREAERLISNGKKPVGDPMSSMDANSPKRADRPSSCRF